MKKNAIMNVHIAVVVMALAMSFYHMVASQVLLQSFIGHLNTHLGLGLLLVFLARMAESKGKIQRILGRS